MARKQGTAIFYLIGTLVAEHPQSLPDGTVRWDKDKTQLLASSVKERKVQNILLRFRFFGILPNILVSVLSESKHRQERAPSW
jgi:hypothetical protein